MSLQRSGSSIGVVAATVLALLLLTPGPGSEHLDEARHDHQESQRIAVEAVHTSLPAHFDASSATAERACTACLASGRTMVRTVLVPSMVSLPPALSATRSVGDWAPSKPQTRLDLSRAPPSIL